MSKKEEKGAAPRNNRVLVVLVYIGIGVLTTLLLTGLKLAIEHSAWGHEMELWAFGKLQGSLTDIDKNNPVVLVDISDLPGGQAGQITSRDKLKEIVNALAEQGPLAIAVDIDFSPKANRYAPGDEDFFDSCLKIRNEKKIPVFLAVGERKGAKPDEWLGREEYKDLAVAVAADKENMSRIPLWVRTSDSSEELKTMSYALALEYRKHLPEAPGWINWAVEKSIEDPHYEQEHEMAHTDEPSLIYADRLVNYSKLDALKLAAQKDISASSVKQTGSIYKGKLVILGDVTSPQDPFPVPGRQVDEGGCLIHASATYTLIKEPLFEFKAGVRLILDFLIAGAIIAMVAFIRYRNPCDPSWLGKQALFIYAAIIGVIFAGWILVRVSGVLWLDFLFVAFALFLHPKLEHVIQKILEKRKKPELHEEQPTAAGAGGASVKAAVCFLAATLMCAVTAQAQEASSLCRQRVAAVALDFHLKGKNRNCYWRENKREPWHKLSAADARKRQFSAGQHLYCEKGCSIDILLCGTLEKLSVTENPPQWYGVLNAWSSPKRLDDSHKDLPARKAQLFRPDNPEVSAYVARAEEYNQYFPMTPARTTTAEAASRPREQAATASGSMYPRSDKAKEREKEIAERVSAVSSAERPPRDQMESGNTARTDRAKTMTAMTIEQRLSLLLSTSNEQRNAKNYVVAEQIYTKAINLRASDPRPYYGLGNVYADQGKWSEAEQAYRRSLRLEPYSPAGYLALGFVLLQPREGVLNTDKLAEAETYLRAAVRLGVHNEAAYDLLDVVLEKRGANITEIELAYLSVPGLNPFNRNLRLSKLLKSVGHEEEAARYLYAAEISAESPEQLLMVADMYESKRQYTKAESLLRRVLALKADDPRALYVLGRVLVLTKNYAEAVKTLKLAAGVSPNAFAPLHLLGMAQLGAGNLDEAERSFDEALKKAPAGGDEWLAGAYSLASVGDAYAAARDWPNAVKLYEKALRYDPDDAETKEKLSEARERLNR
jgi:tetratricopeptide (TPR) repeat protein/CHASE2 domain-containing sensor protein